MKTSFDSELWVPRTMWEKRRQLSAVIHRSLIIGRKMLVLSCDDWTTFFGRVDIDRQQLDEALQNGQMEYTPVESISRRSGGPDLSDVFGKMGPRFQREPIDQIILDDVDMMIDLSSAHAASASMFALLYALRNKCREIILFSNPMSSEQQLRYLLQMEGHLAVHCSAQQSAA